MDDTRAQALGFRVLEARATFGGVWPVQSRGSMLRQPLEIAYPEACQEHKGMRAGAWILRVSTRRGPLVLSWVISWAKYGYKFHKL